MFRDPEIPRHKKKAVPSPPEDNYFQPKELALRGPALHLQVTCVAGGFQPSLNVHQKAVPINAGLSLPIMVVLLD